MMALLIEFSDFSSTIDSIDVGMGMCPAFQFTASTVITIAITSSRLHLTNRWFLGFMMARRHESRGPSPSFIHCSLANYFYDAVVVSLSGRLTKSVNRNNSTKKYSSNQIKEKYEERKRKEKKRRKRNPDGVKRNEIPLLASFDSTDDGRLPVVRCRLPVAGCRLPVARGLGGRRAGRAALILGRSSGFQRVTSSPGGRSYKVENRQFWPTAAYSIIPPLLLMIIIESRAHRTLIYTACRFCTRNTQDGRCWCLWVDCVRRPSFVA